ncbi:MAG: AraC family transcriptional regulator [Ignavibacteriae bacterium]|jgi:hypothetical protein|nr:AraC family transcriptional regulator [Ignavibacteriota bacterium]
MSLPINKLEICEPIRLLVNELKDKGLKVIEFQQSDYHFNELYIQMKNENNIDIRQNFFKINISEIDRVSDNKFVCKCHWSVVELM